MTTLMRCFILLALFAASPAWAQQVPTANPNLQLQMPDSGGVNLIPGQVTVTLRQPDGKVIVGGRFTRLADGTVRNNLLRLNSDGTLDNSFAPMFTTSVTLCQVMSLHWANGSIYVGGLFDRVNGVQSPNIARIDLSGQLMAGWTSPFAPVNPGNPVRAIAATATSLFIGGDLAVNNAFGLARLDPVNGNWDFSWIAQTQDGGLANPPTGGTRGQVQALTLVGSDLFVGGTFRKIAGVSRNGVARISQAAPVSVRAFDAGLSSSAYSVYAILNTAAAVYIGGTFVREQAPLVSYLNRLDSVSGVFDATWIPGISGSVFAISQIGSEIYVGGDFFGGGPLVGNRLFRISVATGSIDPSWTHVFNNTVNNITHDCRGRLIVGGNYTLAAATVPRNGLAGFAVAGGDCLFANGFESAQ